MQISSFIISDCIDSTLGQRVLVPVYACLVSNLLPCILRVSQGDRVLKKESCSELVPSQVHILHCQLGISFGGAFLSALGKAFQTAHSQTSSQIGNIEEEESTTEEAQRRVCGNRK